MSVTQQRVALRRELLTDVGTFSAGCVFWAVRAGQDWRLDLLTARDGASARTVIVSDADVCTSGEGLPLGDAAAAAEYQFARNQLALNNTDAIAWLTKRYGLTPAQLHRLDVDARRTRRGVV